MQYNTIRQYQEGGAIRRALGQAFIGRGVTQAQEELEEEAKVHFPNTVCAFDFMKLKL